MRMLFAFLLCGLAISCKTEKETRTAAEASLETVQRSTADFASRHTPYRDFPIQVKFIEPSETGMHPGEVIRGKRAFIKASGLPDESNIADWKEKHSIDDAARIYREYTRAQAGHPSLPVFRQYASWLILTRLDLLAEKGGDAARQVAFYLQELTDTRYEGYQLLLYTLQYLQQQQYRSAFIQSQAEKILHYGSAPRRKPELKNSDPVSTRPVPQKIRESIDRYVSENEEKKAVALQQIRALAVRL